MRLIATVPARNEAWVLRASIPAMLRWCDAVVVLDHASTDETPDVLGWMALRFPGRLHRLHEADPTWREAKYRARLLAAARELGATHVAVVDADEVLTTNAVDRIRGEIETLDAGEVLRVPWLMLWGSPDRYRGGDGSVWSGATAAIAFRADELAAYPAEAQYDIHTRSPTHPRGRDRTVWHDRAAGLMHLQHVSWRRLIAKQVLYRINERLRFGTPAAEIEARYGAATDKANMLLREVPADWWGPERQDIDADARPWQEAEVGRLLALHDRALFDGLTLFGFR